MNSSNNKLCEGCKHITDNNLEYCYMFQNPPVVLPCAQHDIYEKLRVNNGKKIADKFYGGGRGENR